MKSRWMVFVVLCAGLFLVPFSSHATRLVGKVKRAHCEHPKWSPDGKKLAFEVRHTVKSLIEIYIQSYPSGSKDVVRPAALSSGGFNLGSNSKRGMVAKEFAWSPNSRKYLFSSNGTGTVYNVFMSNEGRLKINSRTKLDGQPAWSKKGDWIAFTSARSGKGDLYIAKMRGSKLKARRLTTYTNSTELFPVWSPKSNLSLAYLRHTDQRDRIYLVKNIFVKRSKRLTRWSGRMRQISELNPSWSPDGKWIAFFGVYPNGDRYDLFVVRAKPGSTPKRLVKNVIKSDRFGPAWSPNGKHIFFVKKLSKNRDRIEAVNVSTKRRKAIGTGTVNNNEVAVASRGGKWHIAFTSQGRRNSTNRNYRKLYVKSVSPF